MTLDITITSICLVRMEHGPDHLYLRTTLIDGIQPFIGDHERADLMLKVARGWGYRYACVNFPTVPVECVGQPYTQPTADSCPFHLSRTAATCVYCGQLR